MDCFHIWYGLSLQPCWMNLTKFGKIHSNMAKFSLSLNYLDIGCSYTISLSCEPDQILT